MGCRLRLVLVIHNHQPVGNFEGVFEESYQNSYQPFLDVLSEYPDIPFSLHTSGSLMEWMVEAHPEYIDRVRGLTESGQVEILGGPFYEPILAGIPKSDRIGQIKAYTEYLKKLFGTPIRGMWVPERVWEQSFVSDLVDAGMEFTLLDDSHFSAAGVRAEKMHGYYLSEDEGRLLKIFPDNETLRYQIPFTDPVETIHYLKQIADHHPHSVVVFGDDGEKFGAWPGTYDHVYRDGWLRRFLDLLRQNSDWLKVTTLGESVDTVSPMGSCYLPDASYREMNEWALSSERQLELSHLKDKFSEDEEFDRLKPYLRGGFWRNFRVKYSELNEMYSRMLLVSSRLQSLEATGVDAEDLPILHEARTELYRAQCNCPYWHGAFGGLYLPHLRNAIFKHLISADSLLEKINHRDNNWLEVEAADFNLDARKEIRLASHRLVSFLSPAHGGHLYELDIRGAKHNLLATLCRRPEPYHDIIRKAAQEQAQGGQNGDDIGKIHNAVRFKQPGLEQKLQYDNTPRKSLMDHFYQPGVDLDTVINGGGELGDFVEGVYLSSVRRTDDECDVRMSRKGHVGPYEVEVTKTVSLSKSAAGTLVVQYELSNLPTEVPLHFGVEFNFAGMAAGASDRYYYNHLGKQLGQLESKLDLEKLDRIGLVDEWLGLDAALDLSSPASIWTFPIETISQSEGGYELVHQSSVVIPHWEFVADDEGRWSVTITLSLDTSAAQAKALSEAAASGA